MLSSVFLNYSVSEYQKSDFDVFFFKPQLGGFFIWTYSYQLIRTSSVKFKALQAAEEISKEANKDFDATSETQLLKGNDQDTEGQGPTAVSSGKSYDDPESQIVSSICLNIKFEQIIDSWLNIFRYYCESRLCPK